MLDYQSPFEPRELSLKGSLGLSRIDDPEPELRREFAALRRLDQRRAVANGILDLSDRHASRKLVEDLLRLVMIQDAQAILQRVPLGRGEAFGIDKITTTTGRARARVGRRW